jgi:hypothetical protein
MTQTPSTSEHSAFVDIADALRQTVESALPRLRAITATQAVEVPAPGKWSAQLLIGHLIDSAANNHQRFVRAQEGPALEFPPYIQDHWVAVQHYDARAWADVLVLWQAYNLHVAHVIAQIPEAQRGTIVTIGSYPPVTLGFLAHDYVAHQQHHLGQIAAISL